MNQLQDNFDWSRNDGVPDLSNAIVILWNGFELRSTALVRHANATGANKVFILKFSDSQFDLSENDKCLEQQLMRLQRRSRLQHATIRDIGEMAE